jgi:hypothetical protein
MTFNRQAIRASLTPFIPTSLALSVAIVACHRGDDGWPVTWPLWRLPVGLDIIRSLLASPLAADVQDWRHALKRGVSAIYQCRRETVGKTRIFTPAQLLVSSASAMVVKGGAGSARVL